MSELADFSFTNKYRPGHFNKDADVLSRLPMDIDSYMKLCTENVSQGNIKACCLGVGAQGRGETVCLSAPSNDSSLLNMEEVSLGSSVDEISKRSLLDAQKQDQVIGRLVTFLKTKICVRVHISCAHMGLGPLRRHMRTHDTVDGVFILFSVVRCFGFLCTFMSVSPAIAL